MNTRTAVATISTASYWPHTAVLLDSLARVCPDWQVYVLGLSELPADRLPVNVTVIQPTDLFGPDIDASRTRFNLFEWACASKAKLLKYVLDDSGAGLAVYVDSDIEFFAPPESIGWAAGSIILTPNVGSTAECASGAWERLHLQFGAYNGGFLAIRNTDVARSFLAWWDERITRYCCTDPALDVFSDQRWLDMVPGLFPGVVVDRNPALNVAVWNLAGRDLGFVDGRYVVGGQPVSFVHYHRVRLGMDVGEYLGEVDNDPIVRALVERYLERLASHEAESGVSEVRPLRDANDGTALPPVVYRAVRDTMAEGRWEIAGASSLDTASLRESSFRNKRLRARLRVLSYHYAHARHVMNCEPEIDRYECSWLFRLWVNLWYVWRAPRQVQLPSTWVTRTDWARKGRAALTGILRAGRGTRRRKFASA